MPVYFTKEISLSSVTNPQAILIVESDTVDRKVHFRHSNPNYNTWISFGEPVLNPSNDVAISMGNGGNWTIFTLPSGIELWAVESSTASLFYLMVTSA